MRMPSQRVEGRQLGHACRKLPPDQIDDGPLNFNIQLDVTLQRWLDTPLAAQGRPTPYGNCCGEQNGTDAGKGAFSIQNGAGKEAEMPIGSVTGRPLEFFILNGATPSGLTIGKLGDSAISEFVTDCFGKRYRYVGLAPRRWSGEIDVDALKAGEFILPPCLVYRLEPIPARDTQSVITGFLASLLSNRIGVFSSAKSCEEPSGEGSRRHQ